MRILGMWLSVWIGVLLVSSCGDDRNNPGEHLRFTDGTEASRLVDGRVRIVAIVHMEQGVWNEGDEFCVRAAWYGKQEGTAFFESDAQGPEPVRAFETSQCTSQGIPEGRSVTLQFDTSEALPATANDDYFFVLWTETEVGEGSRRWIQMAVF